MASRKTLRDQQLAAAANARRATDRLGTESDPQRARQIRDEIVADVDAVVEIVETLARGDAESGVPVKRLHMGRTNRLRTGP